MYDAKLQVTIPPLGFCATCMLKGRVWNSAVTLVGGTGYCRYHLVEDGDPTGFVREEAHRTGRPENHVREEALSLLWEGLTDLQQVQSPTS